MAEYIERTVELILSMRAGARAIANTKKYHGTIYMPDVFSDNPKEIPYLKASEILYAASDQKSADVAPVRHGRWDSSGKYRFQKDNSVAVRCTECGCSLTELEYRGYTWNYCPVCGAKMDLEVPENETL